MLSLSAWWLLFILIVYAILLMKVLTGASAYTNIFFGAYSTLIIIYIFSRFILSYLHGAPAADPAYEPSVTFVVPAKNEEDNIFETLWRFKEADYPGDKIEIIAINDGSTDGTLMEMRRAAALIAPRVARIEVVNFLKNRGKRHGMAEGVKRASHEIVIFVDSDSFIERDSVRALVKYFKDPHIGAVSGHTDVANHSTNTLTRMQAVRYFVSFRVHKAAESVFGVVTCCPGCFSAYRREHLAGIIDEWLHQKFLGKECTFGDDRSLTNVVIRTHRAVYAPEAKAETVVPETFAKYMRQQQRWKKSWVRETLIAATFVWRKNKLAAFFFYSNLLLTFAAPIVLVHALLWNPVLDAVPPYAYLIGLLLTMLLHGIYYRIYSGSRDWLLPVLGIWFYSFVLIWQLPWALVTLTDSKWGTR